MVDGVEQRLVALDVDDHAAGQRGHHFGDAIGAAGVVAPRHDHGAAEALDSARDPFVVGRDNRAVHQRRRRRAAIHVLDHRMAVEMSARAFPGKRVES